MSHVLTLFLIIILKVQTWISNLNKIRSDTLLIFNDNRKLFLIVTMEIILKLKEDSNMPSGKLEDYVVLETIGSGSFGQCQKIRRKGDGKVRHSQQPLL